MSSEPDYNFNPPTQTAESESLSLHIPFALLAAALSAAPADSPLGALWTQVQAESGLQTVGKMAVLPAVLIIIFLGLHLGSRRRRSA